ncbi:MAG TPA: hypothetical protein VF947_02720 [Myxococcales bacterium]
MKSGPFLGLLCLLIASAAMAYILPGTSVLRRMVETRNSIEFSNGRIEGGLSFFGETARQAAKTLHASIQGSELASEGSVFLKLPGRCRIESATLDGSKVAAVFSRGRLRAEGAEVAALAAAVEQICAILGSRGGSESQQRSMLERHLDGLKIDVRLSWLGRLAGKVAYVVGNSAEGAPRFWVYKDSFLPARLQWTDSQQTQWDLRLIDYGSPITGGWFPRIVEVARNGELALRFTAVKANLQTSIPDKVF